MAAYKPPLSGRLASKMHLLDFNERTTALPKAVLQACADWCNAGHTQVYPEYDAFIEKLAEYTGVSSAKLFLGNGSDQLIDCIMRAILDPGDEILIPAPSFSMYRQFALLASAEVKEYSMLDQAFEQFKKALESQPALAIVCHPNNPTGTLMPSQNIIDCAKKFPETWFMVDEAYYEFSKQSILDCGPLPDNVLILRTFSKAFGLASMRIGYMIANETMIEQLAKIRGPYDINQMAVVAAQSALEHKDEILKYRDEVLEHHKPRVEEALHKAGIEYLSSEANFFLLPNPPAKLAEELSHKGIRIRPIKLANHPLAFRLSIGDQVSTDKVVELLSQF